MNQRGAGSANRDVVQRRPESQQLYKTILISMKNDIRVWENWGLHILPSSVPNQMPSGSDTRHQTALNQTQSLR